jgi:hypothetical protein
MMRDMPRPLRRLRGAVQAAYADERLLADTLSGTRYGNGTRLVSQVKADAVHATRLSEASWARAVGLLLEWAR